MKLAGEGDGLWQGCPLHHFGAVHRAGGVPRVPGGRDSPWMVVWDQRTS